MKIRTLFAQATLWVGFAALIILALVLLGNGRFNPNSASMVYERSTPVPGQTNIPPGNERRKKDIEHLKTQIADPNMPQNSKEILKKDLKIVEREATMIAMPPNPHPTVVFNTLDPTKSLRYEEPDGIVVVPVGYSPQDVKIKNIWKGKHGNEKFMVYAGAWAKDLDQGLVIVRRVGKQNPDEGTFFPTPGKFGMMEIIGYDGVILQLKSEKGNILSFVVTNGIYLGFPPATPIATEITITPQTIQTIYPYP